MCSQGPLVCPPECHASCQTRGPVTPTAPPHGEEPACRFLCQLSPLAKPASDRGLRKAAYWAVSCLPISLDNWRMIPGGCLCHPKPGPEARLPDPDTHEVRLPLASTHSLGPPPTPSKLKGLRIQPRLQLNCILSATPHRKYTTIWGWKVT